MFLPDGDCCKTSMFYMNFMDALSRGIVTHNATYLKTTLTQIGDTF